ncbi:tyrosine-type recombinase/integrase [Clostridium sp. LBM24168]
MTEDEFKKVLEHTDSRLMNCIFDVIFHSGLRIGELTNLKIEDVDLNYKIIHVLGKGKKYRDIPISEKIYGTLVEYLNTRKADGDYFFATKRTGKVSQQYINRCLKDAIKKAEISKKISCHSLRHSFATNLLIKGANIQDIRELLGHSNIKVTSIYLHSIPQNLRKSINLL